MVQYIPCHPDSIAGAHALHHRIIFNEQELQVCQAYIADNPRRLLIKRAHPDLFRVYNHLQIGDMDMAACGNIFLLRDFNRMAVRIHRRWLDQELEDYRKKCFAVAENGGVLISPWIHQWERAIRDEALDMGVRIISLRADGFRERFKPSGKDFDLCQKGRLLFLAPWPHNHTDKIAREQTMSLNDMATLLASTNPPARLKATEVCQY